MNYLKYLVEEIHTVIMATVDRDNHPVCCAIDLMDYDENGLYFLTAKGKKFYERLTQNNYISLTEIKGDHTLSSISISICGKVKEVGNQQLKKLFEKNSYMNEIYPTEKSQHALTVFQIYEGNGEWFDLSAKPIKRDTFTFGNAEKKPFRYTTTSNCQGCKLCSAVCPQNCIDYSSHVATIIQKNCLHCGNCLTICPHNAIIKGD